MTSCDEAASFDGADGAQDQSSAPDSWLHGVLEALGWPALLIDAERKVIAASHSVTGLQPDSLAIRAGRLVCADPASDERLDGAVRQVIAPSPDRPVALRRRQTLGLLNSGRERIVFVTVARFDVGAGAALPAPAVPLALATVHDPLSPTRLDMEGLATLFGLTPGELRVAEQLVDGTSPSVVAKLLHLSEGTVRTHLRSIFKRTGTHRQAELVRLLTRFRYP